MSLTTNSRTSLERQRSRARVRRLVASGICAVGFAVAIPMTADASTNHGPTTSYEVPKGIYSTHAKCVAAGLPWVIVHAYSTFRCQGFYSAGKGGYKLYLEN